MLLFFHIFYRQNAINGFELDDDMEIQLGADIPFLTY